MDTKSNVDELNTSSNDTCLICCYPISIYSYGKCLHYICHKCQMRIRVLCDQQECPVCRTSLQKVIISNNYNPSEVEYLEKNDEIQTNLPKWGIYFDFQAIKEECMRLLNDICIICAKKTDNPKVYSNIMGLKLHLQVVHEKYFCEICLTHLKLFTSERAIYTSSELAQHLEGNYGKTNADINNSVSKHQSINNTTNNIPIGSIHQQSTSINFIDSGYKGHPACLFCSQKLNPAASKDVSLFSARFLDQEELYKHLRRDHFFCHFCDAEGRNRYFDTYPILRDHFRAEHFLCEEGECKHERFTTAFRNEIEFKHHMLEQHSRGMDKQSQRLLRAVDLLVVNNNNNQASINLDNAHNNALFNSINNNDNPRSGYRFPTEPSSIYTNTDNDVGSNHNVNNRNRNRGGLHSRGHKNTAAAIDNRNGPNAHFNRGSGPRNSSNVVSNNLSGEQSNFVNSTNTGRSKRPFFAQGTLLPTSSVSTNLNQLTNNTDLNNNQSQQQDVTYLAGGIGTGTIEFYNSNLSNDYDENGFENGFYRRYQMTDQDFPTIAKSNPPDINGNNSNIAINNMSTQQLPNKKADLKVQQIQTNASSIGNSRAPFLPKSYNLTTDNVSATWSNTAKNYHLNDPNAFPSLPKASVPTTKKTSQPITLPSKTKNSSLTCTSSAQNHHAISIYTKPVKSSKQSTNHISSQQKQTLKSTALAPSNVKSDSFETSKITSNSIAGKSKYNPRKDPNFDSSDGEDWQTNNNPSSSSSLAQQFAFNVRDSTVRFSTDDTKKGYAAKIKTMNHPSYRNEFHGLPIIRPDNLIDTPEETFKAMGTGTTTMVRDATLSTLNFPTLLSSGMKNNPKNNQENGKTSFATSFSNVISASGSNSKSSHRTNQGRLLLPPPPITLQPNNPSSSNDYTWDLSGNVSVEQHFPTLKNNGDLVSQNHLPLINDERIPTHEDKKGIRSNAKLKRQKDEDRMLDLIKRLNEKTALQN